MSDTIWRSKNTLENFLKEVVTFVSEKGGETSRQEYRYRNVWNIKELNIVRDYIFEKFGGFGYSVKKQNFTAKFGANSVSAKSERVTNLVVDIKGETSAEEVIIVGAHYDSRVTMPCQRGRIPYKGDKTKAHKWNTPGANDNGSGIAALMALGSAFAGKKYLRTLRLVAWVNEELPFYANRFSKKGKKFYAKGMGSYKHAEEISKNINSGLNEKIVGVISLDTLGCYPGTIYHYPGRNFIDRLLIKLMRFPAKGDYVAFLSDASTKNLVHNFKKHYDSGAKIHSIRRSLPYFVSQLSKKIGAWSDDWSYWNFGYPGFIVTDTAFIRSPNYHSDQDIVENMTFPEFTEVVWQLKKTIESFAEREF